MISLDHVTKRYGATVALKDVSFTAPAGRITGLLGRNGAGKTTALNLMTGYFPPDEGTVTVDGMDMMTESRECKRRIGYLPERPPLYDEMTVTDYLGFVCDLREVAGEAKKKHVAEIIDLCALGEVRNRLNGHLSKGFRQRVGIAQALCGSPDALILDEPTVGLDPMQVVEIRELIRELGKAHTVIFSSHILSEVQQLCATALILHEGRLIRSFDMTREEEEDRVRLRLSVRGREKELTSAIRSLKTVLKIENLAQETPGVAEYRITARRSDERGQTADQLFYLLSAMDAPIRRMIPEKDSLEEVFLRATS